MAKKDLISKWEDAAEKELWPEGRQIPPDPKAEPVATGWRAVAVGTGLVVPESGRVCIDVTFRVREENGLWHASSSLGLWATIAKTPDEAIVLAQRNMFADLIARIK